MRAAARGRLWRFASWGSNGAMTEQPALSPPPRHPIRAVRIVKSRPRLFISAAVGLFAAYEMWTGAISPL